MRASFQRHWLSGVGGPLIADDAGTVAHVVWNGVGIADRFGNSWTQNGTVPQVAKSGRTPAGAGPFSDANYYSLGTGSDVLDFAGNFSAAFVVQPASADLATFHAVFANGLGTGSGYYVQMNATSHVQLVFAASAVTQTLPSTSVAIANVPNVVCIGRSGATGYIKMNLDTLVTAAAGTIAAGTTNSAKLGRYETTTVPWSGNVYEAWFSTTAPSDAQFISIMNRVKARLGITAW